MRETGRDGFKTRLIKEIKQLIPDCVVIHIDPEFTHMQGFPDLLILFEDRWAALECKAGPYARKQPNQSYYVNLLDEMSFASFISPDNKEDVLYGLLRSFGLER